MSVVCAFFCRGLAALVGCGGAVGVVYGRELGSASGRDLPGRRLDCVVPICDLCLLRRGWACDFALELACAALLSLRWVLPRAPI